MVAPYGYLKEGLQPATRGGSLINARQKASAAVARHERHALGEELLEPRHDGVVLSLGDFRLQPFDFSEPLFRGLVLVWLQARRMNA